MSDPVIVHRMVAGLAIATCIVGDGQPVLTLHGWGASLHNFWPVAGRLTEYQVHLLDLPGFGQSDPPPQTWDVADYMRFVVAYLDDTKLGRVDVLAHSFGGRIALMLAAEHPERVHKMVLADSAGLRSRLSLRRRLLVLAAHGVEFGLKTLRLNALRARLQAGYSRRFASEDYRNAGALRETFLRVIEQDLSTYASRVQAPTVLIWGDQDQDTPLWQGRALERLIPDAGLIIFRGAGHFSYLQRLDDYVRIVDHFLRTGS